MIKRAAKNCPLKSVLLLLLIMEKCEKMVNLIFVKESYNHEGLWWQYSKKIKNFNLIKGNNSIHVFPILFHLSFSNALLNFKTNHYYSYSFYDYFNTYHFLSSPRIRNFILSNIFYDQF